MSNTMPSCLLCGSVGRTRVEMPNHTIRWCTRCDLGFTAPRPKVVYGHYTSSGPRDLSLWIAFASRVLDFAVDLVDPKSWLDFGAGAGELLIAAGRRGICGVGVDVDRAARELARQRGVEVVESLTQIEDRSFDVISASHVLEHLEDPISVLAELRRHLTPGGVVVVFQPNPEGLVPTWFPRLWSGWVPAQHIWHFTPQSMARVFQRAGLMESARRRDVLHHPLMLRRDLPVRLLARAAAGFTKGDAFLSAARSRGREEMSVVGREGFSHG
jgi:SAM-dependent methyltransferase